ncbi:MAG: hypothetical protein CMP84_01525 [Gammaproteobacteria bacterium]|nr:hypothetical protein [Gammaproteobacteria bacterium]
MTKLFSNEEITPIHKGVLRVENDGAALPQTGDAKDCAPEPYDQFAVRKIREAAAQQFCQPLKGMGFRICLVERTDELSIAATSQDSFLNHPRDLSRKLTRNLTQTSARHSPQPIS